MRLESLAPLIGILGHMAEPPFERHWQTGLQLLIVGLVGWMGLQVVQSGNTIGRLDERVRILQESTKAIQSQIITSTGQNYRASDARTDFATVNRRIELIENRLNHKATTDR